MLNKIKEYAITALKGFKHFDKLVEGIKTEIELEYGSLPQVDKDIILSRRLVCNSCPFNSINAQTSEEFKQINNNQNYSTTREDFHCAMCGCNVKLKTACLHCNCGIENYNMQNINKLPLKWIQKIY